MKVILVRLSSAFPYKRHLNPLGIIIAAAALIPAYAIFKNTSFLPIIMPVVLFVIGIILPKKNILVKWMFYEAATLAAIIAFWRWLSENTGITEWHSTALMVISVIAAIPFILWTKTLSFEIFLEKVAFPFERNR